MPELRARRPPPPFAAEAEPEPPQARPAHRSTNKWLVAIVVLALAARILIAVATQSWVFADRWHYGFEMGAIASSIAAGNGFSWPGNPPRPTAWMPPTYPFVMAGVFKVFGIFSKPSAVVLELMQAILSALTCLLVYAVGKRVFNARAGLLAAFLFAVYPPSIHFAVQKIWGTTLVVFCLFVILLLFLKLADNPTTRRALALGAVLGFTALLDPVILGAIPFAFVWLYLRIGRDKRRLARTAVITVVTLLAVCSPWVVRNYVTLGQFVFIKSNFGNELYKGNNPTATGIDAVQVREAQDALRGKLQASGQAEDEAQQNAVLLRRAVAFIADHPDQFAKFTGLRLLAFWTNIRGKSQDPEARGLVAAIYFALLALALAGLAFRSGRTPDAWLLWIFVLTLPLPYYITVIVDWRYRFPVEAILIVLAGNTLDQALRWWKRRAAAPAALGYSTAAQT